MKWIFATDAQNAAYVATFRSSCHVGHGRTTLACSCCFIETQHIYSRSNKTSDDSDRANHLSEWYSVRFHITLHAFASMYWHWYYVRTGIGTRTGMPRLRLLSSTDLRCAYASIMIALLVVLSEWHTLTHGMHVAWLRSPAPQHIIACVRACMHAVQCSRVGGACMP